MFRLEEDMGYGTLAVLVLVDFVQLCLQVVGCMNSIMFCGEISG